jgi:DNA-binding CsgD family transcriptional regulator
MHISVKTAETHRNNFGRKLGHPNRAQLFAFATDHHLVDSQSLAFCA